ncbi:MAG: dTDP-glucose 4,6-dehydratase [Bacillota bacterium]|nr:dTDP-glucose 4,6-dehydratase [Bacillota bacterium]
MVLKKVLVTGGAGFIGSNFLRHMVLRYPEVTFVNLDKLTYAADLSNLKEISKRQNYFFIWGDISDKETVNRVMRDGVDAIVNFAAESHVDKSIADPNNFIHTNIQGCFNLLEWARKLKIKKFLQVSTDEVYGALGVEGYFTENSPLSPNNPYSASKAAADCLVRAYHKTYGLNVNITRSSNNYGPHQYSEKFIPNVIYSAMRDEPVPIYGDGQQIRDWIYVLDHCRALELVLLKGKPGAVYNIGAEEEITNLELAGSILHLMGKSASLINFISDRLGHDRRYAVNADKIKAELSWQPENVLEVALQKTVEWYLKKAQSLEKEE